MNGKYLLMKVVDYRMIRNRFLLKSVVYRGLSISFTFGIAFLLTGELIVSGGIAVLDLLFKTGAYYFFEIIWNKIISKKVKHTIWFNGLSGSGKTTIGKKLVEYFENQNKKVFLLDGDVLRDGLNKGLGFSVEDRIENLRRAAEVAKILNQNGVIVVATFITPTNEMRDKIANIIPNVKFVHLETSLEECEARDVKGLYAKARAGEIKDFTGLDSPFEDMPHAWLNIDTTNETVEESAKRILNKLEKK
jgi:adenylylsulfate kinase